MKYVIAVSVFFLCGCWFGMDRITDEHVVINTDFEFSDVSQNKGMKAAFLQYMDSSCVLLRPDHLPIVGNAASKFINSNSDTSFTLTWKPSAATVSKSSDLAFTYGTYQMMLHHNKDSVFTGTYVTIWEKQKDGSWKFVLDSGNEGLGNPSH